MAETEPMLVDFAKSSYDRPIKLVQIYGERRSGTNVTAHVASQAFGLRSTNKFGWKHSFPVFPVLPSNVLFINVVRHPIEWLQRLHASPFEVCPTISDKDMKAFIRAEWDSVFRPNASDWSKKGYLVSRPRGAGETLQLDRHPIEGRKFKNVLEMRKVKLQSYFGMLNRNINVAIVTFEMLKRDPVALMHAIGQEFDLDTNSAAIDMSKNPGPPSRQKNSPQEFDTDDMEFIRSELDTSLEARFGYVI